MRRRSHAVSMSVSMLSSRWAAAFVCLSFVACGADPRGADADPSPAPLPGAVAEPPFVDATSDSGITFVHDAAPSTQRYMPEIVGAGLAMLDYDLDGDLDLYFVQGGGPVDGDGPRKGNELWQNQLVQDGTLAFVDVTQEAGVADQRYGMGVATGDLDNDGDADLLVTNFGRDTLFRNNGDGTFSDVTEAAGLDDVAWSASATIADYDNDGLLDIFVTHYVAGAISEHRDCTNAFGDSDYCSPTVFDGTQDTLFRNLGDLKFDDVSVAAGIAESRGAGLGVVAADFDLDGRLDFFVANDQSANFLWRNLGDGTFEEAGLMSGSAYNRDGMAEASMGVTAADFDGDGDDDLFMTHLNAQTNTLYLNDGAGGFRDATDQVRLGSASLVFTGFGARWFDADNDGDLDLFTANGAVIMEPSRLGKSSFPYEQRNQLFEYSADRRYVEHVDPPGGALNQLGVSRGAAFGDLDNDGDTDIVVSNANAAPQLLLNQNTDGHHWLGVRAWLPGRQRIALGARVARVSEDGQEIWRRVARDGSYLSANDPRVHFGIGDVAGAGKLKVRWPDGTSETFDVASVDRYVDIEQGQGSLDEGAHE